MPPHLLVTQGRIKDTTFPLTLERTVLGRDKKYCDILLPDEKVDPKVSRKHAVIVADKGRYYLKDGDGDARPSLNGTQLNGEAVHLPGRRLLKNRDVIGIQTYQLVFHEDVPQGDPDPQSTIDVAFPAGPDEDSRVLAQPEEKLKALLEITNRLSRLLELDALLPEVVEILLQIFKQADRSLLILPEGADQQLAPRISKTRRPEKGSTRFSVRIAQECVATMKGLLSNDPGLGLRSVMAAPLWTDKKTAIGALLVDTAGKKAFTQEDVDLLLGVADQVSVALGNARHHQDALRWEGVKRDLAMARTVVASFLPERVPELPGYEFFASYESALEVGGDYYDFVPLADNRLGILVGDVSGKGVSAALVMTRFSAESRACLRTEADLAAAVRQLNHLMQPLGQTGRFITLAAMQLDPLQHTVALVNAGHPRPLLLRRATGEIIELDHEEDGPVLGVFEDYAYRAHQVLLHPGDVVVLFSDGVIDAMNVQDHQFGVEGVRRIIEAAREAGPHELGEQLLRAIDQHAAGCRQFDDTTLVCFGRVS